MIDTEGRTYRMLSAALRNSGSGWGLIADTGHQPTGISDVITHDDHIEIVHDVDGVTVSSLQVTVDETYARLGVRAGVSVGVDSSNIELATEPYDRITDQIWWDGTAWQCENGRYSISQSGAILTLTHADMGSGGAVAIGNRGSALVQAGACTATTTKVAMYSGSYGALTALAAPSVGAIRAYVTRYGRRSSVPAADPATVVSATGNLWLTGFIETASTP